MAKKSSSRNPDRSDPRSNKSLAIRTVLAEKPNARASEVADLVKSEYGHDVSKNMIYMVKAKTNMTKDGRGKRGKGVAGDTLATAASWVDAIKLARHLLKAAGSVSNATALLKALADN
jgi:hypothetical protein